MIETIRFPFIKNDPFTKVIFELSGLLGNIAYEDYMEWVYHVEAPNMSFFAGKDDYFWNWRRHIEDFWEWRVNK